MGQGTRTATATASRAESRSQVCEVCYSPSLAVLEEPALVGRAASREIHDVVALADRPGGAVRGPHLTSKPHASRHVTSHQKHITSTSCQKYHGSMGTAWHSEGLGGTQDRHSGRGEQQRQATHNPKSPIPPAGSTTTMANETY